MAPSLFYQFFFLVFLTIIMYASSRTLISNEAQVKEGILSERTLPLINQTVWSVLTTPIGDFFRPGQFNLQLSTLPLCVVLFNVIGNVIAFVIFLYFWKEIYYQVPDPYATADGPAPPQLKTDEIGSLAYVVLRAINTVERLFQ